jgi:hypothetical protein
VINDIIEKLETELSKYDNVEQKDCYKQKQRLIAAIDDLTKYNKELDKQTSIRINNYIENLIDKEKLDFKIFIREIDSMEIRNPTGAGVLEPVKHKHSINLK